MINVSLWLDVRQAERRATRSIRTAVPPPGGVAVVPGLWFLVWLFLYSKRKVERQVKVLIKNLAFSSCLFLSEQFLLISFKIQMFETSSLNQKEHRKQQLGADRLVTTQIWKLKNLMSLFLMPFPFLYILNIMQYLNHES
jgi:hypothetical protein